MRFNGPDDFDLDQHTDTAHTLGIVTGDAGQAQSMENIADICEFALIDVTSAEASTASPLRSMVKQIQISDVINYIGLTASIRGNQVIAAIAGGIEWFNIGGTYYPMGNYVAQAAQGTVLYRIPAKRNYLIEVAIIPTTYAQGYRDLTRLVFGYLPDERERVIVEI